MLIGLKTFISRKRKTQTIISFLIGLVDAQVGLLEDPYRMYTSKLLVFFAMWLVVRASNATIRDATDASMSDVEYTKV